MKGVHAVLTVSPVRVQLAFMDGVGVGGLAANAAGVSARISASYRSDLPASRAPGLNEVTNAVTLSASATSTRTRSCLTADAAGVRSCLSAAAPTRPQTGPVGARQARQASYDKSCNTGWRLEHGGLRGLDGSNLRAKARTLAVETISAQRVHVV